MFGPFRNASADGSSCGKQRKIESETPPTMSARADCLDIGTDSRFGPLMLLWVGRQAEI
jgi:hypothetical protein